MINVGEGCHIKIIVIVLAIFFLQHPAAEADCARSLPNEPQTSRSDWRLITAHEQAQPLWMSLYESGRRLRNRAYWDKEISAYVFPEGTRIAERFLNSLRNQIQTALERQYAEYVFYPDLGHVHLFMPENLPAQAIDQTLDQALEHPELVFLYHTAELYLLRPKGELSQDPWLQWRFYSRNLLGHNDENNDVDIVYSRDKYNTVRELKGYKQIATVYISTSKEGCFPVDLASGGLYLDISINP